MGLQTTTYVVYGLAGPTGIAAVKDHPEALAFAPGAFAAAIESGTAVFTLENEEGVVASQSDGTLELWERPPAAERPSAADWPYLHDQLGGLMFKARLPLTDASRRIVDAVRDGSIRHTCCIGTYKKAIVSVADGERVAIARADTVNIRLLWHPGITRPECLDGSLPSLPGTWVSVREV